MKPEVDPLAELSAAWRALPPPDPTSIVDAPDPATRAAIAWLQDAWRASAPALSLDRKLPWRLRIRLARRRARPITRWLASAAAVLLVLSLLSRTSRRSPLAPPPELASQRVAAVDASHEPVSEPVSVTADRMELRSGPVRLILLTPPSESNR